MKGKTLLSLAIVASIILAALPLMAAKASPANVVEIEFEDGSNAITKAYNSNFIVTVRITLDPGVQIDFWDMEIHWDTAVLELQTGTAADVVEGNFMKGVGGTVFAVQDPVAGILPDIACGFLSGGPASGTGVLMTIAFHAKGYGVGAITIDQPGVESYLLMGATLIAFDPINGQVTVEPPPATPPDAVFTLAGSYLQGVTIPLDGSASVDGIDTLPATHTCPITVWTWEIDEDNDGSIEYTLLGETVSYDPTLGFVGTIGITLTVTAPDPTPPTSLSYVDHDSLKRTTTVLIPATGPYIDIWTTRGGQEPDGALPEPDDWSDAFGPQEEVCVFAKVTYNGEPVEYKPVGFEVIDPDGNSRDFRVDFTDADGIASVCFRIPWVGSDAETLFGVWNITATVDISEVVVTDHVEFRFGYLVSIVDMTVSGSPAHKGDTLTIEVELYNICFVSKNVYVTTVACDEAGVPIGLYCDWFLADPDTSTVFTATITIPSWAFVGNGIVYGNVFTEHPIYGGVPYCPEATAGFILLKTP